MTFVGQNKLNCNCPNDRGMSQFRPLLSKYGFPSSVRNYTVAGNKFDYLCLPNYSRDVTNQIDTCAVIRCTMEMSSMEMSLIELKNL